MTEREWQRLENTMNFIVEQQAKFEANLAANTEAFEKRFAAADRRMDRLERFADRTIKAAERRMEKAEARMAKAEARMDQAEIERAELRAELKSFLESMRRSQGNGKNRH
ncbi:MAG TPA: hypothetical protein VFL79_07805 [Terriglobia bacterium]|nr:hypothetical protein [Terriglobia bacterium]